MPLTYIIINNEALFKKIIFQHREQIQVDRMRSDTIKKGLQRAPHRSLLRACGVTDEEMKNLSSV